MNTKLNNINIIIADDKKIYTDCLQSYLAFKPACNVVAVALNGLELVDLAIKHEPDLIITDISMPEMDGLEATRKIHIMYPSIPIIAHSNFDDDYHVEGMMAAGASGYLLKDGRKEELFKAIAAVCNGEQYLDQKLVEREREWELQKNTRLTVVKNPSPFSPFEIELIKLMCQGHSVMQIANRMELTWWSSWRYCRKILKTAGCKNRQRLMVYALRHGIIEGNGQI